MELNDIDAMMHIWKKENIKAHHFIPCSYWERHYEDVKAVIPHAEVYVCLIEERIAGFIGLDHDDHIAGIFVDSMMQGKGVGVALLNQAKERRKHLSLSVYRKNTHAVHFYLRNDFIVTKESTDKDTDEIEYTMTWDRKQ